MRKCIHRGTDEGCVNSSALSVSPNSDIFVVGSDSGIVNIYNKTEFLMGVRKPMKALTNILTAVDNLKFNCLSGSGGASRFSLDPSTLMTPPTTATQLKTWVETPFKSGHYIYCLPLLLMKSLNFTMDKSNNKLVLEGQNREIIR